MMSNTKISRHFETKRNESDLPTVVPPTEKKRNI